MSLTYIIQNLPGTPQQKRRRAGSNVSNASTGVTTEAPPKQKRPRVYVLVPSQGSSKEKAALFEGMIMCSG